MRDELVAAGWVAEGAGYDKVFACVPPLTGSASADAKVADPVDVPLARAKPSPTVRVIAQTNG